MVSTAIPWEVQGFCLRPDLAAEGEEESRQESSVPGAVVLIPCRCKHPSRSRFAQRVRGKTLAGLSCP